MGVIIRFFFNFNSDNQNYPPGRQNPGHNSDYPMGDSARRIARSARKMAWLPPHLMAENLRNHASWAQHVKQLIMVTAGIETKRQEEMNKGARQDFMLLEYTNWCEILAAKFPDSPVITCLEFTTGTRATKITGGYLYRNFTEGLRVFHNEFNPLWQKTMKEGISGKSKEEVWCRFCYIASCAKAKVECEETTPADFDYRKFEQKKWVYSYKYRGPPCEFLELGTASCHEFLHSLGVATYRQQSEESPTTGQKAPQGEKSAQNSGGTHTGGSDQTASLHPCSRAVSINTKPDANQGETINTKV